MITPPSWSWSVRVRSKKEPQIDAEKPTKPVTPKTERCAGRTAGMLINFCGKFHILAKTITMANSKRQALIQRRKRAMRSASGADGNFARPAGEFQSPCLAFSRLISLPNNNSAFNSFSIEVSN